MKFYRRLQLVLIIILCVCLFSMSSVYAIENIEDYEQKQEELFEKEEDLQDELDETQDDIKEENTTLEKYKAQINKIEKEIDKLNNDVTKYNKEILEKEKEIAKIQKKIDEDYVVLGARLKSLYMSGDNEFLNVLLGCDDLESFFDKASVVKVISDHDNKLISGLNDNIKKVEDDKAILVSNKEKVEKSKNELEKKSKKLDDLVIKTDKQLAKLEHKAELTQKEIEENSEQQQKLSDELAKWHKEYVENNGGNAGNVMVGMNGYMWPTPQCPIITSYWGDGRGHKGWDFACNGSAYGKPIVAVQDGTVVIANKIDSWGSGWGYYIMIDHGNGYSTLYAHCSVVAVYAGQKLKQGETIGYIGNTGNSFGPHLHFECWHNGERYDPALELG